MSHPQLNVSRKSVHYLHPSIHSKTDGLDSYDSYDSYDSFDSLDNIGSTPGAISRPKQEVSIRSRTDETTYHTLNLHNTILQCIHQ